MSEFLIFVGVNLAISILSMFIWRELGRFGPTLSWGLLFIPMLNMVSLLIGIVIFLFEVTSRNLSKITIFNKITEWYNRE